MLIGSFSPSRASRSPSPSDGSGHPTPPASMADPDASPPQTAARTAWARAGARSHRRPVEWAGKGVRKYGHVLASHRRMARDDASGAYFTYKTMEQGPRFRVSVPKAATKDANYRILARQR